MSLFITCAVIKRIFIEIKQSEIVTMDEKF